MRKLTAISSILKSRVFSFKTHNRIRTRPTKEGLIFLGLTFFIGFAALNTGNNLLYLTFGMMLSLIAVSGILSMLNLRKLDVSYTPKQNVFSYTPTSFKFTLSNKKKLIPSYSITIQVGVEKAYVTYSPPSTAKTLNIRCFFKKRGMNKFPEVIISTRFPFGFFKKWFSVDFDRTDILVFPKIEKIPLESLEFKHRVGELHSERSGLGDDLRSLKPFQEGDNPKFIHWKTSAKVGELIVRELHEDESKRAIIEFKPSTSEWELEREITRSASIFLELLKREYEVDFITPERTFTYSQMGRSPIPVLTYLALYK